MILKKIYYFILFLGINFGGLAFGSWLMDGGATSQWYTSLHKAPWTPPGWVFGTAWSVIMICFSWYLATLFHHNTSKTVLWRLYLLQVFLNVSWNWIFFNQHLTLLGLISIIALTAVIFHYIYTFKSNTLKTVRLLLLPYLLWLCIAVSLNAYIVIYN